jgi:hypothetical protein
MSINVYDKGDLVQLPASFVDQNASPADPGGVSVKFQQPDGAITTYVYGADIAVVKDATGEYHLDVIVNLSGVWKYKWFGTGLVQTAEGGQFTVKPSAI